jgi:hypothetical protein
MKYALLATVLGLTIGSFPWSAPADEPVPATAPAGAAAPPSVAFAKLSDAYLAGAWDGLEKDLHLSPKDMITLSPRERADLAYIQTALAECRPAWWAQIKTGKLTPFQPVVWGKALTAIYDPAAKSSVSISITPKEKTLTVNWSAGDMDNPDQAEHGFTKGDLASLGVWSTLGGALGWTAIPQSAMVNTLEPEKLRMGRYVDFRGYVTGIHYATPKGRRWGIWLALYAFEPKNADMQTIECRKAVGAMFLAEVLGNPAKYPSLKRLDQTPAADIENALADHYRGVLERQGLTLAEDKALREAIKAFAAANDADVLANGKIVFANKLTHAVDTADDAPLKAKRDAWLKMQLDKAPK